MTGRCRVSAVNRALAASLAWLLACPAGPALAQAAPPSPPPSPADAFAARRQHAEVLMVQNRFAEARTDLLALEDEMPRDEQVQFLLGLLALQAKDYPEAIARFHRVLVWQPKAVRVRLELGRAYFESGDYVDAERQFRYARAGRLPPVVQGNVDRFLNAIRELKTVSFGLSFAVAPDSNLNAGPAIDSVSLYGLPFTLSETAKANSGIGLALDANAEWSPRIARHVKWRNGLVLHRSQYRQTLFDDMTLTAYSGPHVTLKRWDFNLLGNVSRRWYGDRLYTDAHGASLDATYFVNTRLGVTAGGALNHVAYALNPLQSGNGHSLSLAMFYVPNPASVVRASANFAWQGAGDATLANHAQQFGLSYAREFKGGISASLSPSYSRIAYEGFSLGFGATRLDHQYTVQLGLLDRRIDWHGFTPRVLYTFTKNASNIALYNFKRSRFEAGLTRSF